MKEYIDKIKKGEHFKFMRFGDGEWFTIQQKPIVIGRDEHNVIPEVKEDLEYILENPIDEYYGLQPLSRRMPQFKDLIPDREWVNSDVFHNASATGKLCPLVEQLRIHKTVFIGNEDLRAIDKHIPYHDFIEVRKKDCYYDKDMVVERVNNSDGEIFLYCASRMSVPAIYAVEKEGWHIDCGSLFDPYIGKNSRRYHDGITGAIIDQNLCR